MPTWFFATLMLMISGCTLLSDVGQDKALRFNKPRIHLHLYSSFKAEQERYITAFTSRGYEVEVQHSELPGNEEKSFIIHSPSMLNPNHHSNVDDIIETLKNLGVLEVDQYQYFVGKHSYTPNHVGIYLL